MTRNEALKEAIDSLGTDFSETYEGSELDEPEVIAWMEKKEAAMDVLEAMIKEESTCWLRVE